VARKFKSLLNLLTLEEDPTSGNAGDVYFNVISKNIKIYNGLSWIDLTPGSTDPTPFYMHTHTYDGDVHTVNLQETISFTTDINNNASVIETIPAIIGIDGGTPNSTYDNVSVSNVTLLDGGEVGN
jgi:hypothetical protein